MAASTLRAESVRVTIPRFDPVDWLSRFKAAGGWWMVGADEKISTGWRLDEITDIHPANVRAIYGEIERDISKREALKAHLLASAGEANNG